MEKVFENELVRLRAPEPEDLEYLYRWENDERLWTYSSTLVPYSKFSLRQHIENAGQDIYETKQLRLVVVEINSGKPVGTIDLYDFDPFHQRAGVGILIDPDFQKKGYASQALNLLKAYTFGILHVNQLYAYIPSGNIASLNLFRLCGFVESGILRKWNKSSEGYEDVAVYQCFN